MIRSVLIALLLSVPVTAHAKEIGRIGVDWIGNDVVVEAVEDPKVQGVTCHVAYFSRSMLDRVTQGNWFEDPSNSAIECTQTGPIILGDINRGPKGEEVFSQGRALIFKALKVTRVYDQDHQVLVYLVHSREFTQGSAKMSMSSVSLGAAAKP